MKKLFIKNDDGTYEEIAALAVGPHLKPILKTTLDVAVKKYLEICTSKKCLKNQKNEAHILNKYVDFLKSQNVFYIDEITSSNVDSFESVLMEFMCNNSVNRRFCTIRHFSKMCARWDFAIENPLKDKKKLKIEVNRRVPWTESIFQKFIDRSNCTFYSSICEFLWLTGCRPTEAMNLRWTDIDFENGSIKFKSGKNSEVSRFFPIYPELDRFLHEHGMKFNLVFSKDGEPFSVSALSHHVRHHLDKLGLTNHVLYGIRHGFGTRLDQAGASAFQIAKLMGHTKIETTMHYVHFDKNDLIQTLIHAKQSS